MLRALDMASDALLARLTASAPAPDALATLRAERDEAHELLAEALPYVERAMDVVDGMTDGVRPNDAMRLAQRITAEVAK
jgi:hypothetical protein